MFRIQLANDEAVPRLGVAVTCDKHEIARVDIAPHDSVCVEVPVPAVKRGYLAAPAVTVSTRFPLGLLYSWSRRVGPPPPRELYWRGR